MPIQKGVKRKSIKSAIAQCIEKEVRNGKYKQGMFLPPERILAEEFGVSRNTLRQAMKELADSDLIRISPGRGVYVTDAKSSNFSRILLYGSTAEITQSPETGRVIAGICEEASAYGVDVIISFSDHPAPLKHFIDRYISGDIHGIIFFEQCDHDNYHIPLQRAKVPHLVANMETAPDAPSTRMNYRAIGRTAGNYLVRHGHTKVGLICRKLQDIRIIYKEMLAGFKGALAEDDIALAPEHILELSADSRTNYQTCMEYLKKQSDNLPTAVFCMRDKCAATLYQACKDCGIRIPDDLSVISYDNLSWAEAAGFGLTSIAEKPVEMGRAAVRMLAAWNRTHEIPLDEVLDGEVIERSSCRNISKKV